MIQTDYNNDGCTDILVRRGGLGDSHAQVAVARRL
jgi:hypothetical protein